MTTNYDLREIRKEQPKTITAVLPVLPLDWLLATGQEVTEEKMEAIQKAQRYQNRESMPETYLWMSDLYNELTKQEPTKRVFQEWMMTFEEWKQEGFTAENIRDAWNYSLDEKHPFPVGRPSALTATARAMKSRANKPVTLAVNKAAIEATKQEAAEKWDKTFVPRPPNIEKPRIKK